MFLGPPWDGAREIPWALVLPVAALYHVTGSLDMETVTSRIEAVEPNFVITIAAAVLVAFSLKLGLFPFHFWLPAVYIGSHGRVAAILSGALANIGSYGLLRFGGGILPEELEFGTPVVLILGTASIIYGAHQAVARRDLQLAGSLRMNAAPPPSALPAARSPC